MIPSLLGASKPLSSFAFFIGQPCYLYFIQSHSHPFYSHQSYLSPTSPSQSFSYTKAPSNHSPFRMEGIRSSEMASPLLTPTGE